MPHLGTDAQQQLSPEALDGKKQLDDVIHLAELCVEVLQQNEEHHAEVCNNLNVRDNLSQLTALS